MSHILFGRANLVIDWQFPSRKEFFELMKTNRQPKLSQIKYKCAHGAYGLTHIQIVFNNGMESPIYEDKSNPWRNDSEMQTLEIDTTRVIRRVGFKISHGCFRGIELQDDKYKEIARVVWLDEPAGGKWEYKDVREGEEIIGIKCNSTMKKLGFFTYSR